MAENVRYRVLKPTFVNDTFVDPSVREPAGAERVGKNVFVMAPPGLEGPALELVKSRSSGRSTSAPGPEPTPEPNPASGADGGQANPSANPSADPPPS